MLPHPNSHAFHPIFNDEAEGNTNARIAHIQLKFHGLFMATVGPHWGAKGIYKSSYFHHHIHFVCEGAARITHDGEDLELKAGHAYWLPSNTLVKVHCEKYYRHYFLALSCELLGGMDIFAHWSKRRPLCLGAWSEREWSQDWEQRPASLNTQMRLQGQLYQWIAEQFDNLDEVVAEHTQRSLRFARVFDLLENRLGADLRVLEMAQAYGTSLRAFSLSFTRHLGLSPKAFLNYRLNQEACRLLITSDWPVKKIAGQLHFADEHYFNRFFSKMNGVPPHKYRQAFLSIGLLKSI